MKYDRLAILLRNDCRQKKYLVAAPAPPTANWRHRVLPLRSRLQSRSCGLQPAVHCLDHRRFAATADAQVESLACRVCSAAQVRLAELASAACARLAKF